MEYTFDYLYDNHLKDIDENIRIKTQKTSNIYRDKLTFWGDIHSEEDRDFFTAKGGKEETISNLKKAENHKDVMAVLSLAAIHEIDAGHNTESFQDGRENLRKLESSIQDYLKGRDKKFTVALWWNSSDVLPQDKEFNNYFWKDVVGHKNKGDLSIMDYLTKAVRFPAEKTDIFQYEHKESLLEKIKTNIKLDRLFDNPKYGRRPLYGKELEVEALSRLHLTRDMIKYATEDVKVRVGEYDPETDRQHMSWGLPDRESVLKDDYVVFEGEDLICNNSAELLKLVIDNNKIAATIMINSGKEHISFYDFNDGIKKYNDLIEEHGLFKELREEINKSDQAIGKEPEDKEEYVINGETESLSKEGLADAILSREDVSVIEEDNQKVVNVREEEYSID